MKKIFGLLLASVAMIMGFVSCSADTDTGSSKVTLDVYFTDANGKTDYTDEVYVVTEDADGILQNPVVYLRSEKYLEKAEVLFVTVGEDENIELEDVEERFSTSDQRRGRKQIKLNDFLQSVKKKPGTYLVTLYVGLIGNSEIEEPYEITINIPGDVSTLEITKNIADKNNAVISEKTTLTVTASGSNLTYQWYQDGEKIPGETDASYDVEDEGTYYVVVSDGKTSVTSYSVIFSASPVVLPEITLQPVAMEIADLNTNTRNLTAKATVANNAKIVARWYCNGLSVSAEETGNGSISTSLKPTQFGTYVCKFYVVDGDAKSPEVSTDPIEVEEAAIVITINGVPAIGYVGDALVANVTSAVPCNYTYEWYMLGNDSGNIVKLTETSNTYTLTDDIWEEMSSDDSVNVYVKVKAESKATGEVATKESSRCTFEVAVVDIPVFTTQPSAQSEMFCNEEVTLSATAEVEEGVITYQWYKDDSLISGATNSLYKVTFTCKGDCSGEVDSPKEHKYYVIATNTLDGKTTAKQSDVVAIKVKHVSDTNGAANGSFQF
ncbi:MAG: hypothetical protein U0K92_08075 [Treponema sp.]|nr:hypothetical protein [Treponema sp.]